ncbi:hypothetical protein [Sphaerisporangium flaviroseum]|uniref:hypothetical protein n=1 Tax=Sphaerisporangium flaviroseum TaxID=509199 RepID=UPI0031ECCB35
MLACVGLDLIGFVRTCEAGGGLGERAVEGEVWSGGDDRLGGGQHGIALIGRKAGRKPPVITGRVEQDPGVEGARSHRGPQSPAPLSGGPTRRGRLGMGSTGRNELGYELFLHTSGEIQGQSDGVQRPHPAQAVQHLHPERGTNTRHVLHAEMTEHVSACVLLHSGQEQPHILGGDSR